MRATIEAALGRSLVARRLPRAIAIILKLILRFLKAVPMCDVRWHKVSGRTVGVLKKNPAPG
jgi:hypothetical protein